MFKAQFRHIYNSMIWLRFGFAASKDLPFTTIRMRGLAPRGRGASLRSNLLHLGTAHFTGACRTITLAYGTLEETGQSNLHPRL